MCKKSENNVKSMWVYCGRFCVKKWVGFINILKVGKSIKFFTFQPTFFQQAFLTHRPLLCAYYSPTSTVPITTTNNIKENI